MFATEVIGTVPMSGVTTVIVNIINDNDNNPIFNNATYTASIAENVNAGAFVAMVIASDLDKGVFGDIVYSLSASGVGVEDFNITGDSGIISTAIRLDHETRQTYSFQVLATDQDPEIDTRKYVTIISNMLTTPTSFTV